ncbi:MAG TPA: hypothetical protein VFO84_11040 [Dehalococcoidia bacterium]|nr:hypothetical protein [Dehalococcoidia bacterium]
MRALIIALWLITASLILTSCRSDSEEEPAARAESAESRGAEHALAADAESDEPTVELLETSCLSEEGRAMHRQLIERARLAFAEAKAKAEAVGAETGGDAFDGEFSAPLASTEEIESIFTFNPPLPAVPDGWIQENFLRLQSPTIPLVTCDVQITLHDPSGPIVSFDDFEPGDKDYQFLSTYEYDYGLTPQRGATVDIRPADRAPALEFPNVGLAGWHSEWTKIHGQQAVVTTVDYYIENSAIRWIENGISIGVSCQLITREECIALAESFN